jgi:hypothetical protein
MASVAVPKKLDCTIFSMLNDGSASVDSKCVDAYTATCYPYTAWTTSPGC